MNMLVLKVELLNLAAPGGRCAQAIILLVLASISNAAATMLLRF